MSSQGEVGDLNLYHTLSAVLLSNLVSDLYSFIIPYTTTAKGSALLGLQLVLYHVTRAIVVQLNSINRADFGDFSDK